MIVLAAAVAVAVFTVLFVVGVWVLARGAKAWADALAAVHTASFQGVQAAIARSTDEALVALKEDTPAPRTPYERPSDQELEAAIIAERAAQQRGFEARERAYTTEGNEGIEETPPIPGDGMYATATKLDAG